MTPILHARGEDYQGTVCRRHAPDYPVATDDTHVTCLACRKRLPTVRSAQKEEREKQNEIQHWAFGVEALSHDDRAKILRLGRSPDWTTADLLRLKDLMRRIAADLIRRGA